MGITGSAASIGVEVLAYFDEQFASPRHVLDASMITEHSPTKQVTPGWAKPSAEGVEFRDRI